MLRVLRSILLLLAVLFAIFVVCGIIYIKLFGEPGQPEEPAISTSANPMK